MPKRTYSRITGKIGIALITCDRPEFFEIAERSLEKIPGNPILVVINDGESIVKSSFQVIRTTKPFSGVGIAKNTGLKFLIEQGCEHLFLMEDDIKIIDPQAFNEYIRVANKTGVKHLNFGLHGNHNLDENRKPVIRKTVKYSEDTSIDLYPNLLGALSYYHIDVIESAGYIDEEFYNGLEHVSHTYDIIQRGYHPPFRWFADIADSYKFIRDIVPDHEYSKIRSEVDFRELFRKNLDIFIKKHKFSVVQGYGPPEKIHTEHHMTDSLKSIWKNHTTK